MLTNLSSGKMSRKTYKQNVREKATRASVVPPDDDRVESLGNLLKLRAGYVHIKLTGPQELYLLSFRSLFEVYAVGGSSQLVAPTIPWQRATVSSLLAILDTRRWGMTGLTVKL
ncbi:hypothetical protein TIFTF001_012646 [Ficus carica]|uniref:Uncharacterized protein n=2 Tax=Ficus carica TaxID=3494 RepID=A0AA87ZTN2_FICCA|nr:hypothetical protein TIFTF001_012646 [Ficus carica]